MQTPNLLTGGQGVINEIIRNNYLRNKLIEKEMSLSPALYLIKNLKNKPLSILPKSYYTPTYYATPTTLDMAVIITYFNPAKSVRILQNFLQVRHFLQKANIPVYIGEVAFGTDAFLLPEAAVQLRTTSYMFYKENLNKLVEQQIPTTYTKLCIMDADILFEQADWYDIVHQKLDEVQVCQLCTTKTYLNINFVKENSVEGHVWAFQRAWYKSANLPDHTVIGASDLLFAELLKPTEHTSRILSFYKEELSLTPLPATSIGVCPLSIVHLFHGDPKNRTTDAATLTLQIALRRASCKTLDNVLERRADGLLEWKTSVKQQFNTAFHRYFVNRHDDEVGTILFDRFTPTPYASSERDMAIIIPFLNMNHSVRAVQNILTVKHFIESAGYPVFIGEMAFEPHPFLFNKESHIIQFRSDSCMFYRDKLISAVETCIPSEFTKLCIIEPDILFGEPTWYSTVSTTLDRVNITQPFKRAFLLELNYTSEYEKTNCIDKPSVIPIDSVHHATGMVWAFNRKWYQQTAGKRASLLDLCTKEKSESCELSVYQLHNYSIDINKKLKVSKYIKSRPESEVFANLSDTFPVWAPSYKNWMNTMMRNILTSDTKKAPMQKTVVHAWVSDCVKQNAYDPEWIKNAGLGDLVRGSIGLYKLCKQHNYNFIVDISLHPLSKFLNQKKHTYSDIVQEQKNAIVGVHHKNVNNYITTELTKKDYVICHSISWLDTFDIPADEDLKLFIKNILKPNRDFTEVFYSKMMSLPFSKYNLVHFRLGDEELVHNKVASDYTKYITLFESVKCDIPNTLLLSDSNSLKKALYDKYNVFSLSHDIAHVGMQTDTSGLQNTMVEFFLLINATSIVSFTKYQWISGFARIASYIYNVPLKATMNI